jgi:uncharacterized cupin superfamily protein
VKARFGEPIEEAIYVISGRGVARIGESRLPVRAGDWLAFPIGRVSEGSCGS